MDRRVRRCRILRTRYGARKQYTKRHGQYRGREDYEGADFTRAEYDLYETPVWIDMAADRMERALELALEAEVLDEQVRLLSKELRTTTQRVNLFEKVKIPEAKENIRKISVFLGDERVAAVVRSKISKRKLEAEAK